MTREEASRMAKAALECMEREVSGCDEMCNSHKCDECALNYEKGNMGEQQEWLRLAIKALEQTRWTPVSEGLPKPFSYVNCTLRSLIDDRAFWVVETCYVPQPKNSPYSDWGNIPMLNHGDCAVVAWMYREIPKPYKAESEDK